MDFSCFYIHFCSRLMLSQFLNTLCLVYAKLSQHLVFVERERERERES